MDWLCLD